jgi:hypothetical protein
MLRDAGYDVSTETVDVSSCESVHSWSRLTIAFGDVTGVIHAAGVSPSQAPRASILAVDLYGTALVLEGVGNVMARGGAGVVIASQSGHRLGALTADQVTDLLQAYQLARRGNSLRGEGYRPMIELCPSGAAAGRSRNSRRASDVAPTARSSPGATFSWTGELPRPTSTASSLRTETIWLRSLCLHQEHCAAGVETRVRFPRPPLFGSTMRFSERTEWHRTLGGYAEVGPLTRDFVTPSSPFHTRRYVPIALKMAQP